VKRLPPFVSVIVSFHNESRYLKKCVQSLLDLDYPKDSYEVVLINDGSTDGSEETINDIVEAEGSRITILKGNDRGPATARNLGIKAAKGEIVAITDPDCIPDKHWLAYHIQHYENQNVGAVQGRVITDWHNLCHPVRIAPVLFPYVTCNISYRARTLREVGPFDEQFRYKEDQELAFRLLESGWLIEHELLALVYHPVKKLGIRGVLRYGLRHMYDPLLYKKHSKTAASLLRIRKIGPVSITREFLYVLGVSSFILATIILLLCYPWIGFLSALMISIVIVVAHAKLKKSSSKKAPFWVMFLALVREASRLYGSLKFRKFLL